MENESRCVTRHPLSLSHARTLHSTQLVAAVCPTKKTLLSTLRPRINLFSSLVYKSFGNKKCNGMKFFKKIVVCAVSLALPSERISFSTTDLFTWGKTDNVNCLSSKKEQKFVRILCPPILSCGLRGSCTGMSCIALSPGKKGRPTPPAAMLNGPNQQGS